MPSVTISEKSAIALNSVSKLESSVSRMNRLAGTVLHGEPYRRLDEIAALIDAVTLDEVRQVAAEFFAPERQTLARLGPERAA